MTHRLKEERDRVVEVEERDLLRVRTLLNSITEMIGISLESNEVQEQRDSQEIAQRSIKQAVRVVDKWLERKNVNHSQEMVVESGPALKVSEVQHPLQILVAEDDPINQRLISRILTKKGHLVTLAGNGRIAIDFLSHKSFDIILMDIQMPLMDGIDAVRYIRESEHQYGTRIPIIAITGMEILAKTHPELLANIDGYLRKPINSKLLIQAIEDVAKEGRQSVTEL